MVFLTGWSNSFWKIFHSFRTFSALKEKESSWLNLWFGSKEPWSHTFQILTFTSSLDGKFPLWWNFSFLLCLLSLNFASLRPIKTRSSWDGDPLGLCMKVWGFYLSECLQSSNYSTSSKGVLSNKGETLSLNCPVLYRICISDSIRYPANRSLLQ